MRARNIKPSLFKNEVLGQADPIHTLAFQGLWCLADREGRLEDRPLRIHAEIFPYRASTVSAQCLHFLEQNGFIHRYAVGGKRYIQIINFTKHQNCHVKEKPSDIPAPTGSTVQAQDEHGASTVQESPLTDSLLPLTDSPLPLTDNRKPPAKRACALPDDFSVTPEREQYAITRLPSVDVPELMESFKDYHRKEGTTAKDWDASWRTWVRNGLQFGYPKLKAADGKPVKREATPEQMDAAKRAAAEQNRRQLEKVLGTVGR